MDQITSDAGSRTLDAASDLFAALASIEHISVDHRDAATLTKTAASKFKEAAILYRTIAGKVNDLNLAPLSPAEYELAAIEFPLFFIVGSAPNFDGWLNTPKKLYNEIIIRLETISSRLADFVTTKPKNQLAYQAFQLMHDWDMLARLGRVIAVINQRRPTGVDDRG